MGRARALGVMLSAQDYDADVAERYGWINRALPADQLDDLVNSLAHRIASFPAAGRAAVKERVDAIALAPVEEFRRDSNLFAEAVHKPDAQGRIQAAMRHGFQTPAGELRLGQTLGDLADNQWGLKQSPADLHERPTTFQTNVMQKRHRPLTRALLAAWL